VSIAQEDIEDGVADALQYISCFHPPDFVRALRRAWEVETSRPAREAMLQLLVNSRLSAEGRRPICQDTGLAQVYFRVGVEARFHRRDGQRLQTPQAMADRATRRAYTNKTNPLRATVVADPLGERRNTGDNTPAVISCEWVEGAEIEILVVAKGGGGDIKARFATLNPSDDLAGWIIGQVPGMGAGWCPPGVLGVGIGGTPEVAMALAKRSLFTPIDMAELKARGARSSEERLRVELHERINALGIGAQGLGGLTTVLDVKVACAPVHAAALPVALVPNCAATRFLRFSLNGTGPLQLRPPPAELWDGIAQQFSCGSARRVNLDVLDHAAMQTWQAGDTLLLSGRVLTARDAAHKRLIDLIGKGEPLPVDLRGRVIYYVGPVDAVADETVGPAGPTTATRMDKFVETLLAHTGLLAMIGKAERGPAALASIRRHRAAYLSATGGAAYLLARSIVSAKVLAFNDLGMEAIREFTLQDFPVTVAVDPAGNSVYRHFALEKLAPDG
jgi:fumarate hydratase class I